MKHLSILSSFICLFPVSLLHAKNVNFQKEILPILERKCFDCHGPEAIEDEGKYEAGLNLSTRKGILKGSEKSRVLIEGKAKISSLYTRTALPDRDKKQMPKKGRALDDEDKALLAQWINEGASFGTWAGVGLDPVKDDSQEKSVLDKDKGAITVMPTRGADTNSRDERTELLKFLNQGVPAITDEQIHYLQSETGAYVNRLSRNANLLEVVFAREKGTVDLNKISPLEKAAPNIIELKLAETPIRDEAAELFSKMTRLNKLDLRGTSVSANTIRALTSLKTLETINLSDTKMDKTAVTELNKIKSLKKIYVQGTSLKPADFKGSHRGQDPTYQIEYGLKLD